MSIKRLFLDVESTPNVVYSWRTGYRQTIPWENIIQERQLCSLAWAWNNEPIQVQPWDWINGVWSDLPIVATAKALWARADEIVGHNLLSFDAPWLRARGAFHKLGAMPDTKLVDTCRLARRRFFFNSNSQDYISRYLNGKAKLKTDFKLWVDVMRGERKARAKMVRYNKRDVSLLRQMYYRLDPYCNPTTHVGVLDGKPKWSCPYCGSVHVKVDKKRVTAVGYVKYQFVCNHCHKYFSISESAHRAYQEAQHA